MNIVCLQNVAILMGLLVVSCVYANYIGCYWLPDDWPSDGYFISNMSGQACKQHCCPNYRYAGVSITNCYCGRKLNVVRVDDSECDFPCPDPQYNDTCGRNKRMSVFDTGAKPDNTTETTIASTERPCLNHSTPQETNAMPESTVLYVSVAVGVVSLAIVLLCSAVITWRYMRSRSMSLENAQTLLNNSCYKMTRNNTNTLLPRRNNIDEEVVNDVLASNAHPPAEFKGEYDRLEMPAGVFFIDSTYSHTDPRRLQGPCLALDNGYSHCEVAEDKRKDIAPKTCTCAYNNVHFSRSGKVKIGRQLAVDYSDADRDYSYDKLQSNLLTQSKRQLDSDRNWKRTVPDDCADDKQVRFKQKSSNSHAILDVKDSTEIPVKEKRSNTYDEIEI